MSSTQPRAAVNTVLPVKITAKAAELPQCLTELISSVSLVLGSLLLFSVEVRRGHRTGVTLRHTF